MGSDGEKAALDQVRKMVTRVYGDLLSIDHALRYEMFREAGGDGADPVLSLVCDEVQVAMGAMAGTRDLLAVAEKRRLSHGVRECADKTDEW